MKVIVSSEAQLELERIGLQISRNDFRRGISLVGELLDCCHSLAQMPERYALVPRYADRGIRRAVYKDYLIFYRIDTENVQIVHIVHGALDYDSILSADPGE